jgi:hypothetical protein
MPRVPAGPGPGVKASTDPMPAIRTALEHLPQTCRYHGTDFGKLGWEGWPGAGSVPRCDSCKPAHARTVALLALGRLAEADHG